MFENIVFGFCELDIVAGLAFIAVGIAVILQHRRHKKRIATLLASNDSEKS